MSLKMTTSPARWYVALYGDMGDCTITRHERVAA